MDNREKQAAFKQRMRERGMAQVNEWIPTDQVAMFKRVAAALRDGVMITIGEPTAPSPVSSNPPGEGSVTVGKPSPVAPKPVSRTNNREESPATRPPATLADQYALATETTTIRARSGRTFEARTLPLKVTLKKTSRQTGNLLGVGVPSTCQTVAIYPAGKGYRKVTLIDVDGKTISDPPGYQFADPAAHSKAVKIWLRKAIKTLHPDTGTHPDAAEFQRLKEALDSFRGRPTTQ